MKNTALSKILLTLVLFIGLLNYSIIPVWSQQVNLDDFESTGGWNITHSDGVNPSVSMGPGVTGNAIRFDYDFSKGTGFGGIQKWFPIDLPENYEFTFYLKAESPANNFEIKFIDSTGNNVWWVNNRNFTFPGEWKKFRIRKRHINFAWGPISDTKINRVDRIEFTIASYVGGKGTIWIDNLRFEPLPPEKQVYPVPECSASSSDKGFPASALTDSSSLTSWKTRLAGKQEIMIDFKTRREFGGLYLKWMTGLEAADYEVELSYDGMEWDKIYHVQGNRDSQSFIRLAEAEARYIKIILYKSTSEKGFGIEEIEFPGIRESLTLNDFLLYSARHSPPGNYPVYFSGKGVYWTITGVNNDVKEALINEDGMVEAEKVLFSVQPMVKTAGKLYNWSNIEPVQTMGDDGLTPTVTWKAGEIDFITGVQSSGEANHNSFLAITYTLENTSEIPLNPELYLLIRPYQVNPYYQFLNITGGAGRITRISGEGDRIKVDDKIILSERKIDSFHAIRSDEGNPVNFIRNNALPAQNEATDLQSQASGVIRYTLQLAAGQKTSFRLFIPYHNPDGFAQKMAKGEPAGDLIETSDFWKVKTGHVSFNLPTSADPIIETYRSNLAYILINRDKAGIQPGSRSYERSWIRDGALTSSALLKAGITEEVKDFIEWYSGYLFENGKVPCVVDFRGPDPVPENDSHGQFIYLIREYFNFTGDTAFLRSKNEQVLKATEYIHSLIMERSTDHFRNGNDSVRAYYGLVPESISHEGYSAKPMHSYWDNFFTMKGLKDAAEIQKILGEEEKYKWIAGIRDTFRINLYQSLQLAMKTRGIDFIPGCVELGDFDATSTTIALTPCNELKNLPKPQVYNTFNKYYQFFLNRRDGLADWVNYTPYENRLIGSFILLDQPGRAHDLIDFFLADQRPKGWNHWAEVVWKDYRAASYIGDMPHTWCGSDFLNSVRSMFVYENEYDQTLVLAAALYQDWIDAKDGMSVENLPTYYGELSYSILKDPGGYTFTISGELNLPSGGIEIRNFNGSETPTRVTVNGNELQEFTGQSIRINEFPAVVRIFY